MSEPNTNYIMDIKKPTRGGFVACLVVTPTRKDGSADTDAKLKRNLGREKAVQMAYELLKACEASADLLEQVHALAPELKQPITA